VEEPAALWEREGGLSTRSLLQIVFRDTGTGIPEQIMLRLFEPFVTSKERGIGLGLAISRQIMQEHGGRLTATNQPPDGAMFVVEVPLTDAAGIGQPADFTAGGSSLADATS